MFFGNSQAKDEEILQLKKRVAELESQLTNEQSIVDEINEILLKTKNSLYDCSVKQNSSSMVLNGIKNNLNDALKENARVSDIIIKTLIEYGNANFAYDIDAKGISGKSGSILLGIKALGNTVSELLAILNNVAGNLNNDMTGLHNEALSLSSSSNQQAASLEETAAALEEITATIINTSENTVRMRQISKDVEDSAFKGQNLANDTFASMDSINNQVSMIDDAI